MTESARDVGTGAAEWRRGWPVVLAAMLGYGNGMSMTMVVAGLFVRPMQQESGWSTSALTIVPIMALTQALCLPFAGILIQRFGSRSMAIWGLSLLALGVLGLAVMPMTQVALYAVAIFMGMVGPLTIAPFTVGVATWFSRAAGSAFGVVAGGLSVIGAATLPVVAWAIHELGWRSGFATLSAIIFLVGLPPILLLFRERVAGSEEAVGNRREGLTLREAAHDLRFWILIAGVTFVAIAVGGFLTNLQPMIGAKGFAIDVAASLGVVYIVALSLGRIGGGILLDHFNSSRVACSILLCAAAGAFMLAYLEQDTPIFLISLAVFFTGLAQGAESDFMAFFTLKLFGLRAYAIIFTIIAMAVNFGVAMGGALFATLFDRVGDYGAASQIGGMFFLTGAAMFTILGLLKPKPAT